jgi:hypothetical protein
MSTYGQQAKHLIHELLRPVTPSSSHFNYSPKEGDNNDSRNTTGFRGFLRLNHSGDPNMKILLTVTAAIEVGAGAVLMGFPTAAVKLLLDSPLDSPAGTILGRIAGSALCALGIGCWLARGSARSPAAGCLVAGMLFYNVAAVGVFTFAGLGLKPVGVALWPAVILHAAMAGWCIASLWCGLTTHQPEIMNAPRP